MLEIFYSAKFKKDYKRIKKQGKDLSKLTEVLGALASRQPLPARLHDHELAGIYKKHRECHIEPDWLLIYRIDDDALILTAVRTGTHSDLFDM